MRYVQKVLLPEETVLHESRLHWIIYLPGLFALLVTIVAALVALLGRGDAAGHANPYAPYATVGQIVAGVALLIAIWLLLGAWIRQVTTEIAVTSRRIIFKQGLISRRTIEMNTDKVESVDVDQSILGRLLDYGTIMVRGTGAGLAPLHKVADPLRFRSHVVAR